MFPATNFYFDERVEAGIRYLDSLGVDWRECINLESLDLESSQDCIIGQVFGDYDRSSDTLGLTMDERKEFGFTLEYGEFDHTQEAFRALTNCWKKHLTAKLELQ